MILNETKVLRCQKWPNKVTSVRASSLIEIFWSDLTFKQLSSRIYRSAGTPVLLLSRPEYSEVALECLQSGKSLIGQHSTMD